jgi:hypothetical protein
VGLLSREPLNPKGNLGPNAPDINPVIDHSHVLLDHADPGDTAKSQLGFLDRVLHRIFPPQGRLTNQFDDLDNRHDATHRRVTEARKRPHHPRFSYRIESGKAARRDSLPWELFLIILAVRRGGQGRGGMVKIMNAKD